MSDSGPWLCESCRAKNCEKSHSTDTRTGQDAGCPRALWVNGAMVSACQCRTVVPRSPKFAPPRCPTCGHAR